MSWRQFVRCTRRVKLGGRAAGPLRFGGRVYTVGPLTCLRVAQMQEAYGTLAGRLGSEPLEVISSKAPLGIVRLLLPLLVLEPVRACDVDRATPEQVAALAQALGETNDLEATFKALAPSEAGEQHGLSLAALVCSVAKEYGRAPREVWLWPFAEVLGVIDAEKELNPREDDGPRQVEGEELDELNRRFAAYGLEVAGG